MKPSTSRLFALTRLDFTLAGLLGFASLVLYVRTLAPGLLYGDSGELQTVVYSLGMTHPTGYPVYVLLGRLFALLPVGEPAWRVNLFSAVLGALTIMCVYLIVRLLSGWRPAAMTASLSLAVTPLFWYFSVIAELYVPACAFIAGVLLFILLWRQTGKWRWLAVSGLLGGLSLGVHSSVALIAPGILAYLVLTSRSRHEWVIAVCAGFTGLALALAAFLWVDGQNPKAGYYHATVEPSLSVWEIDKTNFDTPLERLNFLYSARQFQYAMFKAPAVTMPAIAGIYGDVLLMVFAPLSLFLMVTGLAGFFVTRHWQEGLLLISSWGTEMFFVTNYDIYDVVVFFVPTFVFLAVGIGSGLGILMHALDWIQKRPGLKKTAVPIAVLFGVVVLGLTFHFWSGMVREAWVSKTVSFMRGTDFAEYPYPIEDPQAARDEAQAIVETVEEDAIVFLGWDLLFPCYHIAQEKGLTAMDFHETFPQEGIQRLPVSAIDYIEANIDTRPIYFTEKPFQLATHFQIISAGTGLFQIKRK